MVASSKRRGNERNVASATSSSSSRKSKEYAGLTKKMGYSNNNTSTSTKPSRHTNPNNHSNDHTDGKGTSSGSHTHGSSSRGSSSSRVHHASNSGSNTTKGKSSKGGNHSNHNTSGRNNNNNHHSKHSSSSNANNNNFSNTQNYHSISKPEFMSSSSKGRYSNRGNVNYSNYNNTNTNNTSSNSKHKDSNTTTTSLRKPLDPTLLARGMTARAIGSRISNHIKGLSNFEIDKDIRHMEAYGAACIVYAQQYFAFTNRDLVVRGHYGPVQSLTGMGYLTNGVDGENGDVVDTTDALTNGESKGTGENGTTTSGTGGGNATSLNGKNGTASNVNTVTPTPTTSNTHPSLLPIRGITMPIRIDPEEEKRLTILRNRVSISESKREVLETEYLSLRAHYVHESHKLRRARDGFTGQLKLLRDLVIKRGNALAMYRVRYAMAKDILHSLEYRSEMLDRLEHGVEDGGVEGETGIETDTQGIGETEGTTAMDVDANPVSNNDDTATPMEGIEQQPSQPTDKDEKKNKDLKKNKEDKKNKELKKKKEGKNNTTTTIPEDLTDIYERIESQLHEAELACANSVETPEELLLMKAALAADALALEAATEKVSMGSSGLSGTGGAGSNNGTNASGASGTSTSLFQRRGEENDSTNASGSGSGGGSGTANTSGGGTSGENSTTSTSGKKKHDKSSKNHKNAEDGSTAKNSSMSDAAGNGNKKTLKGDGDSNVIPWNCPVMPRTPYDVAILLSNLSTTPDCSVAFACGDTEGRQSNSLLWLESNLPSSQNGEMDKEEEKLQRVREDVRLLQEELSQQIEANSDLQKEIIKGRKRRDQLCSMMSMIRSETEAVIERYNDILQTPEAMLEVENLHDEENESITYEEDIEYDEEGELGDGEHSEEGTVIADEDDGEENVGDQNFAYDDDNGGQPMREITVRIEKEEGSIIDSVNRQGMSTKRGYEVATEDSTVDPGSKRRKII